MNDKSSLALPESAKSDSVEAAPPLKVKTEEELAKPGWVQLDGGVGPIMGRIEVDPKVAHWNKTDPPDWSKSEDAEAYLLGLVQSQAIVRFYWPIAMRKVTPTQDAFIAYLPDPDNLPKTMYMVPYVLINLSRVLCFTPLQPLKNKGITDFFRKFFEDVGGRVMTAPASVAAQMAGMALPQQGGGGPISKRILR